MKKLFLAGMLTVYVGLIILQEFGVIEILPQDPHLQNQVKGWVGVSVLVISLVLSKKKRKKEDDIYTGKL